MVFGLIRRWFTLSIEEAERVAQESQRISREIGMVQRAITAVSGWYNLVHTPEASKDVAVMETALKFYLNHLQDQLEENASIFLPPSNP